ncbi:MAG: site-2 protease family protein [Proteobacteria bacterium]|nr:site-2 protease family protein [Pseudomonadota bacterium]
MFGKRVTLFKLFGFAVRVDMSWLVLAVLVTWSLARGFFPYYHKGLLESAYWSMGVAGALGLFISIIFHELSHSLVAKKYGLPISGITLFIFGGVAEMEEQPESAKIEFLMAVAGPVSSMVLAVILYGVNVLGMAHEWPVPITGVLSYLASLNVLLAVFNLVPAFPLDGGRILRAALWGWKDNLRWATRIASRTGSLFSLALIIGGFYKIVQGNFIGGFWWIMIGMFLKRAADMSYQQVLVSRALQGEPVSRFMRLNPVTVTSRITVAELIEDYIYTYHFKMFPVVDDGKLLGCITTRQVKELPREEWGSTTIGSLIEQCSPDNSIHSDMDATQALATMSQTGASRLMVVNGDHLAGIITLKNMLQFLSLKIEFEEEKDHKDHPHLNPPLPWMGGDKGEGEGKLTQ